MVEADVRDIAEEREVEGVEGVAWGVVEGSRREGDATRRSRSVSSGGRCGGCGSSGSVRECGGETKRCQRCGAARSGAAAAARLAGAGSPTAAQGQHRGIGSAAVSHSRCSPPSTEGPLQRPCTAPDHFRLATWLHHSGHIRQYRAEPDCPLPMATRTPPQTLVQRDGAGQSSIGQQITT